MKYRVRSSITWATGEREYEVEADSPEDAIVKAQSADCTYEYFSIEQEEFEDADVQEMDE